jgi:hypothetical protein
MCPINGMYGSGWILNSQNEILRSSEKSEYFWNK